MCRQEVAGQALRAHLSREHQPGAQPAMAAVRAAPLPSPLASGATDFAAVSSLTNLNEINRLLHETLAKERTIDLELDKLLNKRGDLEKQLVALQSSTAEV